MPERRRGSRGEKRNVHSWWVLENWYEYDSFEEKRKGEVGKRQEGRGALRKEGDAKTNEE